MNLIHFLVPKLLIALSYINIDPVQMAGFKNSQENFYGWLSLYVLNAVRNHHSQWHRGRLYDNDRQR
jgi:hypothetical protein